ncbi:MAG: hypothetical protein H6707_10475 [Deltaproteobacteria bacterium]|nr:hypothetical protein [Deltaproteobacteria bacterium]
MHTRQFFALSLLIASVIVTSCVVEQSSTPSVGRPCSVSAPCGPDATCDPLTARCKAVNAALDAGQPDGPTVGDATIARDAIKSDDTGPPPCLSKTEPTRCGTLCVNTDTDDAHCGGCDQPCGDNANCREGKCVCVKGFQNCDGNLPSNGCECQSATCDGAKCPTPDPCAGVNCGQNAACNNGQCSCLKGYENCDLSFANGCECTACSGTNCVLADPCAAINCGSNATCISKTGLCECRAGYGDCDKTFNTGCEVQLGTAANCSQCGDGCLPTQTCQTYSCTACGGCISNNNCMPGTSVTACGTGGAQCKTCQLTCSGGTAVCNAGKCAQICPTCGDGTCNGSETCATCEIDCRPCKPCVGPVTPAECANCSDDTCCTPTVGGPGKCKSGVCVFATSCAPV